MRNCCLVEKCHECNEEGKEFDADSVSKYSRHDIATCFRNVLPFLCAPCLFLKQQNVKTCCFMVEKEQGLMDKDMRDDEVQLCFQESQFGVELV